MRRTLVTITSLAFALAAGGALAQQQQGPGGNASGPTVTEKIKEAAHAAVEKTKEVAEEIKDKATEKSRESKAEGQGDTSAGAGKGETTARAGSRSSASGSGDIAASEEVPAKTTSGKAGEKKEKHAAKGHKGESASAR